MPADPRITIARTESAFSHAASSWSEPITLMSCALRGEIRSATGRRTIWLWTIVSTSVGAISLAMTGLRMSASMKSIPSSAAFGFWVSSPATYSTSGSCSRRRASSVPRWLAMPVIRMRRPATLALARARAALARRSGPRAGALGLRRRLRLGRPLLQRAHPPLERPYLLAQRVDVVGRRRHHLTHARANRLRTGLGALDNLVERLLCAPARLLRSAERRLDRPLDRLAHRVGQPLGCRPAPSHLAEESSISSVHEMAGTIHLNPSAPIAERVLLPGDPQRALAVAQALLESPRMLNARRGLWGYTGTAPDGGLVTVQSTGMGGPSAAIVAEELIGLGARTLVRIGTCGALVPELALGELVAAEAALAADGTSQALGAGERVEADPELTSALAARRVTVVSTDVFYEEREGIEEGWVAAGALAVEMESATLFTVARRRGV